MIGTSAIQQEAWLNSYLPLCHLAIAIGNVNRQAPVAIAEMISHYEVTFSRG
jgi:hypothetical protein